MSKRRSFKGWELQDFQKYCNDNYAGMSRSEVQRADPGFYQIVRNKGFTDEVLPKSKLRDFTGWELQDYKDHTNDNYAGMSRSEIRYIDRIFYGKIRREGFIDEVLPESKKRNFTGWELQDYKDHMNDNYAGMSRSEIGKADPGFYRKVRKKGFTDEVLPGSKKKPNDYWKDTENVQKGLEPIIEELGRFPTWSEIDKRNSTLNVSINKYHGSLTQVRIKLGYAEKEMEVLKEILEELGNA